MADSNRRFRQYVGLAIVVVAYVGGIIGWSWAALTVEPASSPADTTQTRRPPPDSVDAVSLRNAQRPSGTPERE